MAVPVTKIGTVGGVRTMYQSFPGRGMVDLTEESWKAIEEFILWAENVPRKMPYAMDVLARFLALLGLGVAHAYSGGVKRSRYDSSRAWQFPVPRLTWRYYLGFRVERLARGTWLLTNDSREAFFIEFGIHQNSHTGIASPRRIRRPVFKYTLRKMFELSQTTAVGHRFWHDAIIPKPGEPGSRSPYLVWYGPRGGIMFPPGNGPAERVASYF